MCWWLLLGVDGRDIRRRFGVGRHQAGLFPMTYEIFEILDGSHDGGECGRLSSWRTAITNEMNKQTQSETEIRRDRERRDG